VEYRTGEAAGSGGIAASKRATGDGLREGVTPVVVKDVELVVDEDTLRILRQPDMH
jgi:hypothetical protein